MSKYDIIGDIHGYAEELKRLLAKLGYFNGNHPEGRQVIFVGDYIDRGPQIRETLDIVKGMVDAGNAIALMGNHEYNAICYNTIGDDGEYLRTQNQKNLNQHAQTLHQFINEKDTYQEYIDWFKTLPLFLEIDGLRAVHATWDQKEIEYLKTRLENNRLTDELLKESTVKDSRLFNAIEITLKGKEVELPAGQHFKDKDGHRRHQMRVKWWLNPLNQSFKNMSVIEEIEMDDHSYETNDSSYYHEDEKPVFFGHYWLKGEPNIYRDNICCLDYSVAKDGYLTAYRWDGEQQLSDDKLVYVRCESLPPKRLTWDEDIAIMPPDMQLIAEYETNGMGFSGSDAYIAKAKAHSEKMRLKREKEAIQKSDLEKPTVRGGIIKEVYVERKYKTVRLEEVADVFYGRPSRKNHYSEKGDFMCLYGKNIGEKQALIFKSPRFVDIQYVDPRTIVQQGDIIICTSSSIERIGNSAVYCLPYPAIVGKGLAIIRAKDEKLSRYIYKERYRIKMLGNSSHSMLYTIKMNDLKSFEIELLIRENE